MLDQWIVLHDKSVIQKGDLVVHLEPKIMDVLVYMLQNANRVISREELTEQVWQSSYTSDEVITRAISVLRKKLGDTAKVHKYIKTIPKHGYILELPETEPQASVEQLLSADNTKPLSTKFIIYSALIMTIAIVVLFVLLTVETLSERTDTPIASAKVSKINLKIDTFSSIDQQPSTAMVANVLSQRLLSTLSNSNTANVVVDSDSLVDLSGANVDFIIRGGVQQVGEEYHVTVYFINADNGDVLWSQSFAGDQQAYHTLVNNVSQTLDHFVYVAVIDKLDLSHVSLKTLQAAMLRHEARQLRRSYSTDNLATAKTLLENAVLTYPNEWFLYSELAWTYMLSWPQMDANAQRRVQQLLDTLTVNGYQDGTAVAAQSLYDFRFQGASLATTIQQLESAIALQTNPIELQIYTATLYRANGEHQQAVNLLQTVLESDSEHANAMYQWATLQSQLGNSITAIGLLDEYLKRHPNESQLHQLLMQLYVDTGKFSHALIHQNRLNEQQISPRITALAADSYYYLQRFSQAKAHYQLDNDTLSPPMVLSKQCRDSLRNHSAADATSVCKELEQLGEAKGRLLYARALLLAGEYEATVEQFAPLFNTDDDSDGRADKTLVSDRVDYIYALSKAGQKQAAQRLARELLVTLTEQNRMGYLGYGVSDVILLLIDERFNEAGDAFAAALNDGWLHWFDPRYGGPHPGLMPLQQDSRFEQWQHYIEVALDQQRNKLN